MEYCGKSKISNVERKQIVKRKLHKVNGKSKKRKPHGGNNLPTSRFDGKRKKNFLNEVTEFDEAERLFLPNFNNKSFQATRKEVTQNYPDDWNVDEYQKLKTEAERRNYRNSKDLRNHLEENINVPEYSDHRICHIHNRGEKCVDETCVFTHELRLQRRLRLCTDWKSGACPRGQFCLFLHSEFPCRFHYLGLPNPRHDPKTCRYYHGGPLPEEYEEMFLKSVERIFPTSREMYNNQLIHLKATACSLAIVGREADMIRVRGSTMQQEIKNNSHQPTTPAEIVIEKSPEKVPDIEVNSSDVCKQNDVKCK